MKLAGFRLGLAAVWLFTGLLGSGLVDMFLEPDPNLRAQILRVIFLPVIAIPAVMGLASIGWPRRERDDAQ